MDSLSLCIGETKKYPEGHKTLKATVRRFYMGGPRNRFQLWNMVYFKRFFSIPVVAAIDFLWYHGLVNLRLYVLLFITIIH